MNGTAKFIKKTKQIDSFLLVSAFKDLKQNSAGADVIVYSDGYGGTSFTKYNWGSIPKCRRMG